LALRNYNVQIGLAAFHANFINSNKKNGNLTARSIIGDRPILSDEIESEIKGQAILDAFKKIFPEKGKMH